ncbi:hypothetical protein [Agrococcus sp. SCSIO52902]|uniref:hypothetical protein n=1 Tax=Agrococcus sp. SCSIO52902 TaxID=2933290 RepID=UPI001FF56E2C|nr:hypothetical protein [Agrococcus sp. SCSIO52902]UOW01986.1 hypothetical protein MU522_06210 [Agrococcus sp. SCSIO52902]
MSRTAVRALRASAAVLAALALAACAQPAAPAAPSSPAAEPAPTGAPTASATPAPSASAELWRAFESQDGAVRLSLPPGWTVEDRSAVEPESEMYNTGPGWLNDLVVRDGEGDAMLVYQEHYGNDSFVCAVPPTPDIALPVDPYASSLRTEIDGERAQHGLPAAAVQVRSGLQEEVAWDGERDVPTGEWSASLGMMMRTIIDGEDCGWAPEIWAGNRIVMVEAVADRLRDDGTGDRILFGSEQAARDWLESEEVATLIDVLESLELTGAPVLEEAP